MAGIAWAAPTDLDWHWDADGMLFPRLSVDGYVKQMFLQDDGALVVGVSSWRAEGDPYVSRFDPTGRPDVHFGTDGRITVPQPPYSFVGYDLAGIELRSDGGLDLQWYYSQPSTPSTVHCWRVWTRALVSGQPDLSFGQAGLIVPPVDNSRSCGLGDRSDTAGKRYRIDRTFVPFVPDATRSWIHVAAPDGASVPAWGPFDTARWWYASLRIDARDRLLVGLTRRQGADDGFAVGRTGGGSFGANGIAFEPLPGAPSLQDVLPLPDGGVLVYGATGAVDATGARQAVIVRFTEEGRPDAAFGEGGAVVVPFAHAGDSGVRRVGVAPMPDGRMLVVAEVDGRIDAYRRFVHLRMARLMADGTPDTSFAENGIATVQTNGETLLRDGPVVRPSGEFLIASSNVIYQFRGGDLAVRYPPVQRTAVEYFHAGYGHYFTTADVLEIATLDAAPASGWVRTAQSFDVYASSDSQLAPVCRFWSGQNFAPKSSHFYTPYADECAKVKQDPAWRFERNAFYVRMPEGAPGAATCTAGTRPLYRAYNQGQGGAPNHRYTIDPAVLDGMIARGWTMEGEAATRVFACVPVSH